MGNKYSNLLNDTLIFALGNIGSKLILFLLMPIYTNYLSAEEYGIADYVFTVSQLIIPIISFSISHAVLRYGLSIDENKDDVLGCGLIVFLLSLFFIICLVPIFSCYDTLSSWKWYISGYVSVYVLNVILLSYIKTIEKNKLFSIISILQAIALSASTIVLVINLQMGIKGYIVANIISCLCAVSIAIFGGNVFSALKRANLNTTLLKSMLLFSSPIIFNEIFWWLMQSSSKVFIDCMLDKYTLGLYSVASKIPALLNVFILIFSQAWGISTVKELETTNDRRFYTNVFNIYALIAFGISMLIIPFIKAFIYLYLGEGFFDSWRFVPLLLASASFSAVSSFWGTLYSTLKMTLEGMHTTFMAAIINLCVSYVLIHYVDVWGVLFGNLTSYVVVAIIRMKNIQHVLELNIHWRKYILNSTLLISHSIFVTTECFVMLSSCVLIICFIVINRQELIWLINKR